MSYSKSSIGNVSLFTQTKIALDNYTDNEAEDTLLDLFKTSDTEAIQSKRNHILANDPTWPLYYHLNYRRENLLKWYEFKTNAKILEVGAGCGGITEGLVKKNVKVTALELASKRATINAYRNKHVKNLEIYVDNLENFIYKPKFDYIVCVGVLEYAGTFIHKPHPYKYFLKTISNHLKTGGSLLLAIENRFGMKYWTGAKEDHVHTFFEGHNQYPGKKNVQTFGRKELKDLLLASGFNDSNFYYPFPDYKNPSFVYSDYYYPGNGATFPIGNLPTPTLDRPREDFMSEQSLMMLLEANDMFRDFSNSFLIEAIK